MASFDVPFTSDVLDVDQFVTGQGTSLLASALVNGRVGLADYSPLAAGQRPDEGDVDKKKRKKQQQKKKGRARGGKRKADVDNDGDDVDVDVDVDGVSSYEGRLFTRPWTVKPGSKSCRGVRFTEDGRIVRTISKDRSAASIDVETGQVTCQWAGAHEYVLLRAGSFTYNIEYVAECAYGVVPGCLTD